MFILTKMFGVDSGDESKKIDQLVEKKIQHFLKLKKVDEILQIGIKEGFKNDDLRYKCYELILLLSQEHVKGILSES